MKFQNCIQCAVGIVIPFTSYFGFPSIKYRCCHIAGTKARTILCLSKSRLCIALCIMFFLTAVCVLNGINMKNSLHKENAFFNVVIHFTEFTLHSGSIMIMAVSLLRVNTMIGVVNTVQDIVDKWEELTSKVLLSEIDTFKLRTRILKNLVLVVVLVGTGAVILFSVDSDPTWSTVEKVGMLVGASTNLAFAIVVDIVAHLYMVIFGTYGKQLKIDLIRRLHIYTNLNNLLVSYSQLHIKLKRLIVLYNTFLNPSCLIWLIIGIILLICATFLILICYLESESVTVLTRMIVILIILCVSGYIVFNLVESATNIIKVGRDQLEFFFGYPVTNLTREEADKFEILKTFFIKLQSTFTMSEIVFVDMRLVGAVSGTVLTYVVVAIQFKLITWNQK